MKIAFFDVTYIIILEVANGSKQMKDLVITFLGKICVEINPEAASRMVLKKSNAKTLY